ncbi:MAG: hypothetical protein KKB50_11235 [Planctomycetes bacterium]|nr:hypothetical protein [Planctomycetota bacterium]
MVVLPGLLLVGCESLGGGGRNADGLTPVLDRMRKAYADLESGRFVSLAHFESTEQAKLFRAVGSDGEEDGREQPSLSVLRSRNETGAGGLKARLAGPDDVLRFDGKRSEELALIRDWTGYAVLLLSVYGPREAVALEFSVCSGRDHLLRWTSTIHTKPGWNLHRFDLAEIGDAVDLADVRALTWQAPTSTEAVDLYLDDLILADNTRHLMGEDATSGQLYVYTQGRRIHVGARGRFDLAFADGVIASWYADGEQNLTLRDGLGPRPVLLDEDWDVRDDAPEITWMRELYESGRARFATQRIEEMSEFRVVIVGEHSFGEPAQDDGPAAGAEPVRGHSWTYTIYPTGAVYVQATSNLAARDWGAPLMGYAVALNGRAGFQWVPAPAAEVDRAPAKFVLLARRGAERADLLWTLADAALAERQRLWRSGDERRQVMVVGNRAVQESVSTAHLLRFWPRDVEAAPEAESLAADYQNPAAVAPLAGRLIMDVTGDLDGDGYNESEGCHELELAGNVLRFTFEPGRQLRYEPVFRVHGTMGQGCWVYADGRIVSGLGRDRQGRLLFSIPRVVNSSMLIEVNSGPPVRSP